MLLTRICNEGEKHCCSLEKGRDKIQVRTVTNISLFLLDIHDSTTSKHTFFPIPLVGDGAGDTGTKSMRFGDDDADFSKSLSLCMIQKRKPSYVTCRRTTPCIVTFHSKVEEKLLEYYTTDSVCP